MEIFNDECFDVIFILKCAWAANWHIFFYQFITSRAHWSRLKLGLNSHFTSFLFFFKLKLRKSHWPHASPSIKLRPAHKYNIVTLTAKYHRLWCMRPPSNLTKYPSYFVKMNADVPFTKYDVIDGKTCLSINVNVHIQFRSSDVDLLSSYPSISGMYPISVDYGR